MITPTFDPELNAVVSVYNGFLKHEDFKTICEQVLHLAQEKGISKILVDTQHLKVMLQESQQWINQVWFPQAKEIGIRHMAFLMPEDIFGKMSMEATNRKIMEEESIDIRYFQIMEEARAWLKSV